MDDIMRFSGLSMFSTSKCAGLIDLNNDLTYSGSRSSSTV